MTPAQERELRDKVSEALGLLRTVATAQDRHGRKLDKLDARQDATDIKLAVLVGLPDKISALERWRYMQAGGWVVAGVIAGYAADWLMSR